MKNKKKLVIVIMIILLVLYFGYKGFSLIYYHVDYDLDSNYDIKNTITINHKDIQSDNYLQFKNIKIRNDFKDYEKLETSVPIENTSDKLVLKDENNHTTKAFWMGTSDTYVYLLKADKTLYGTDDNRITNANLTSILEKNNIHNDIKLFNYLSSQEYVRNNIFTSVKNMKENYAIQFMTSVMMPTMNGITLINGDYEGYIFNLKDNMKEVSILKDDKRYVFSFINDVPITDEYLTDILSTITID